MPHKTAPDHLPNPTTASLLEHVECSLVVLNPLFKLLWFNQRAAHHYTLKNGKPIEAGQSHFDYSPGDHNKNFLRNFTAALGGKSVSFERKEVGHDSWTYGMLSPYLDQKGQPCGVVFSQRDITAQKLQEIELEEGENVVRAIDGNDLQAFVLLNAEGQLIRWNRKAITLMMRDGVWPKKGRPFLEILPTDWLIRIGILLKVARQGGIVSDEFDIADTFDGAVELHIEQIKHDGGALVCVWGHDITEQKRAARSLRDSESNLRTIFDSSLQTFILIDRDLRILAFNATANRTSKAAYGMGLSVGMKLPTVLDVENREETYTEIDRAFNGERFSVIKMTMMGGSPHWFERHYDPVHQSSGVVDCVSFWSVDITQRMEAEEALRENEEKFRTLATLLPVGIYQTDAAGGAVLINDAHEKLLGMTREEIILGDWTAHVEPNDFKRIRETWERVKMEQSVFELNYSFTRTDGKRIEIYETAVPLLGPNGEANGYIGCLIDMTDQLRAQRLEQEKAIAERALKFRSDFLANMSHEIRTPLNGIMSLAELLTESLSDSEKRSQAQNILHSATDLRSIVNEVLELSKLEAGKVTMDNEHIDLEALINRIVAQHAIDAGKKGLTVNVHLAASMPKHTNTDGRRLAQVLGNLMRNAVKFTTKGKVSLVCRSVPENQLLFEVSDTGPGIPEADLPKLFQDFSQLNHTTAQNMEGTGLGLSICKKLVHLLGGEIGVSSQEGSGSTFWFTIQMRECPDKIATTIGPQPNTDLTGIRVMLVEDNLINQQAFKTMLRKLGCVVTTCNNGKEAVDLFRPEHFDIIFMDIQMPQMDGIQATSMIRGKHDAVPPIVGLSGNVVERDATGQFATGMDDLLLKPVVSHELERKLRKWAKQGHDS